MNTTTIETIIQTLSEHNVLPDEEFTAAAGADFGYAAAYVLPKGDYVVQYGDNGETHYDITDDISDLATWLLPGGDGTDAGEDKPIVIANIRGIDAITAAAESDEGPFRIISTHSYYGPTEQSTWATDQERNDEPLEFDNYVEASEWIEQVESNIYTTSHNESGRPTHTIVTM